MIQRGSLGTYIVQGLYSIILMKVSRDWHIPLANGGYVTRLKIVLLGDTGLAY